jgi:hypothetical protein
MLQFGSNPEVPMTFKVSHIRPLWLRRLVIGALFPVGLVYIMTFRLFMLVATAFAAGIHVVGLVLADDLRVWLTTSRQVWNA